MADTLQHALASARQLHTSGADSVLDILLRSTEIVPFDLKEKLQLELGVRVVMSIEDANPEYSILGLDAARRLGCVPLRLTGDNSICLGMADPWDQAAVMRASNAMGHIPELAALPSQLLRDWLGRDAGKSKTSLPDTELPANASGPVVDFVGAAMKAALQVGASDVHFECDRGGVTVKLRQDGVMVQFAQLADRLRAEEVISRIKVLAQLDITERRTPQDGRFRLAIGSESIDFRVSIMPSVHGEDAVLRLLDKARLRPEQGPVTLDMLGFGHDGATEIRELSELPHGMLLVTGPTGSGKTTTVYAVLSEINTGREKIITIEDPVEYELPGVLQIPVNERKGLTFAKGLRSILRHDPDRILVGEIRDAETAEIAVQSALTGHQVFTTVHANSVFDVIGRFRHFGLDMFGFMSSLNGLVVQRLVRRLCPRCCAVRAAEDRECRWLSSLGFEPGAVPRAVGCLECLGTGYKGRLVIAEVHVVDDEMRDLVMANSPVSAQRAYFVASGVMPLAAQGAQLVQRHVTTPEEIRRVVGWK